MCWWNLFHGVSWVSREISMNMWPTWNEWSFGCNHPPFLSQLLQIRKIIARNQIPAFSCLDKGYGEDKTRLKYKRQWTQTAPRGIWGGISNSFAQCEAGAALGQVPGMSVESLSLRIFSTQLIKSSGHMIWLGSVSCWKPRLHQGAPEIPSSLKGRDPFRRSLPAFVILTRDTAL